jgi:AraC family transcriptional regulator
LRATPLSKYGHGDRKYLQSRVLVSSIGRGWSGIAADLRANAVCEVLRFDPVHTEVTIAIRGCSGFVLRTGGGERQETRSGAGKIWLSPAGVHTDEICIMAPHEEVLHLYLPAQPFSALANDDRFRIGTQSLRYWADSPIDGAHATTPSSPPEEPASLAQEPGHRKRA